jgi:DNA-binding NarL/FixJ family response regulator
LAGRRRSPIRIGIVDDHPIFRLGLKRALEREPDLDIAWELDSAVNLVACMDKTPVDLVFIDIYLGARKDGLTAARTVSERWPEVKIAAISASLDAQVVAESTRAGADVFLRKEMPVAEIVDVVRKLVVSVPQLKKRSPRRQESAAQEAERRRRDPLSARQRQVLEDMKVGRTNREIAARLGVSVATVNPHVHDVLTTLGVRNRTEAVASMSARSDD